MNLKIQGTPNNPQFYSWGSVQPDLNQSHLDIIQKTYVTPLLSNIRIFDNTNEITADQITSVIYDLWSKNRIDGNLDHELNEIYTALTPFKFQDTNLIDDLFGLQALHNLQLPHPSNNKKQMVVYTIEDDIVPAIQNLNNSWTTHNMDTMLASMYGFIKTRNFGNILFIGVKSDNEWNRYKTKVLELATATQNPTTILKANDFNTFPFTNQLSQSVLLSENSNNTSFEYCLLQALHELEKTESICPLPVNIKSQIMPSVISFFNINAMANATPTEISNDIQSIRNASVLNKTLKVIPSAKLRTADSITPKQSTNSKQSSKKDDIVRRQNRRISSQPLSSEAQLKRMMKLVKQFISTRESQNTYKSTTQTYMRPNRRKPLDYSLKGKSTRKSYHPDIHIYFDTSGSISEDNYKASALNIIKLAIKMDVDIYVSFFSHVITQPIRLKIKNRTAQQIFNNFIRLPKVGGGTDFNQFWNQINAIDAHNKKSGKSYRINFVITDFCDRVPRDRIFTNNEAAVKNTFYIPITPTRSTHTDYSKIIEYAKDFALAMYQKGIDIYSKLIM